MSRPITAYVHKGCKTCKRATDYMEERGVPFERVELFEEPPTAEELRGLLNKLSMSPRELLRPRDRMYRELDLKNRDLPDRQLIGLLVRYPGLIKRPILVTGEKAVVALRPEDVDRLVP